MNAYDILLNQSFYTIPPEKIKQYIKNQENMIRGLKNIVLFCFGIMAVELVLIILLIWRHHG